MNPALIKPGLRVAGWAVVLMATVFLWGSNKSLRTQLSAKETERAAWEQVAANQKTSLDQKDALILKQSASIDALAEASKAGREVYRMAQVTAAASASNQQQIAKSLMALQAPFGELEQCRAARDLLEQELVQ